VGTLAVIVTKIYIKYKGALKYPFAI